MKTKDAQNNIDHHLALTAACKPLLHKAQQLIASLQRRERQADTSILKELEQALNTIAANLEEIEATTNTKASATLPKALHGLHVLLADDDDIAGAMAIRILERNGALVTRAYDGAKAVELSTTQDFDLALLDVQMPGMSGLQASAIIRREQKKPLPIIAITAEKVDDISRFLEAGMNNAVAKPFKEKQLVDTILDCLKAIATNAPKPALYSLDKLSATGDQAFVVRMLNLFLEQVPSSVTKLKEAYQASEFETVKYLAHRIRPALSNMNIAAERDAYQVEELAETNAPSPEMEQLISKLETVTTAVAIEIRTFLDDNNLLKK